MTSSLVIKADDLVGHPEKERPFKGTRDVSLRFGDSTVAGPMAVVGMARGTVDGVMASFTSSAQGHMKCVRCLIEWDEEVFVSGTQHFAKLPEEDGYAVEEGLIDVGGLGMDELALALPLAPIHDENCKGLCPVCGNDLNSDPCDGHEEGSDSPFAVLKDLFDS